VCRLLFHVFRAYAHAASFYSSNVCFSGEVLSVNSKHSKKLLLNRSVMAARHVCFRVMAALFNLQLNSAAIDNLQKTAAAAGGLNVDVFSPRPVG
jgi:hypothetical protein